MVAWCKDVHKQQADITVQYRRGTTGNQQCHQLHQSVGARSVYLPIFLSLSLSL